MEAVSLHFKKGDEEKGEMKGSHPHEVCGKRNTVPLKQCSPITCPELDGCFPVVYIYRSE